MNKILPFFVLLLFTYCCRGQLVVSPTSLSFTAASTYSAVGPDSATVTGAYLTPSSGTITVIAPANFEVSSTPHGTWFSSYTINYTGGSLASTKIYVEFNPPASSGIYSGCIVVSGGGYSTSLCLSGYVPCSGTPYAGHVVTSMPYFLPGDTLVQSISGATRALGLLYQWQSSPDSVIWTDISGETNPTYAITSMAANTYFREMLTCPGYASDTSPGQLITLLDHRSDSFGAAHSYTCSGITLHTALRTGVSASSVVSRFGDGSSDTTTIGGSTRNVNVGHTYSSSGSYTVSQVLYAGTTPMDSLSFSAVVVMCTAFPVHFYLDSNGNCRLDAGEYYLRSPMVTEVDSNGVAIDTIASLSGFYVNSFGRAGDIYSFRILSGPAGISPTCPASGILYDTITTGGSHSLLFAMQCDSIYDDISVRSIRRYGSHMGTGTIYVSKSAKCDPIDTVIVHMQVSPKFVFSSYDITPTTITTWSDVTWTLRDVSAAATAINYTLTNSRWSYFPGDTVASDIWVGPTLLDLDTSNNWEYNVDTIRTAWDPNFVEATPQGCLSTSGTTLTYTIGFENDGNDTAHNIHVMDTLSNYLDASTLKPLFATHVMDMETFHAGGMTIVKFDFPNIMLPDSVHHETCHGMFQYAIKARPGLADGTIIPARVGIYFDDNDVVMTNTWTNRIGCPPPPLGVSTAQKQAVHLYPNPTGDKLNIEIEGGRFEILTITNSVGATVISKSITGNHLALDVKELPAGMYYVTLRGAMGVSVQKFVKE